MVFTQVDPDIISNSCVCKIRCALNQTEKYFLPSNNFSALRCRVLIEALCNRSDDFLLPQAPRCEGQQLLSQFTAAASDIVSRCSCVFNHRHPSCPTAVCNFCFNLTPNQLSCVWGEAHRKHGKGRPFQNRSSKGDWMSHLTFNLTDFLFFASWANLECASKMCEEWHWVRVVCRAVPCGLTKL